jgi:hypothetical protein
MTRPHINNSTSQLQSIKRDTICQISKCHLKDKLCRRHGRHCWRIKNLTPQPLSYEARGSKLSPLLQGEGLGRGQLRLFANSITDTFTPVAWVGKQGLHSAGSSTGRNPRTKVSSGGRLPVDRVGGFP